MGPEQLIFLLTDRKTMEREARHRLMMARGISPQDAMEAAREEMRRRRKKFTGKDTIRELDGQD